MNDLSCWRVALTADDGHSVAWPIIAADTAENAEVRAVEVLGGHAVSASLMHTEAEGHPRGHLRGGRARAAARKAPVPA